MLVIDASFAGALVLPDELDPPAALITPLAEGPLIAPSHWPFESANMLQMALRRGRIDAEGRDNALQQLDDLLVAIEPGDPDALRRAISLADRHGLTIYDAAYLETAVRLGATLASRDHALIAACKVAGAPVMTF